MASEWDRVDGAKSGRSLPGGRGVGRLNGNKESSECRMSLKLIPLPSPDHLRALATMGKKTKGKARASVPDFSALPTLPALESEWIGQCTGANDAGIDRDCACYFSG